MRSAQLGGQHNLTSDVPLTRRSTCPIGWFSPIPAAVVNVSGDCFGPGLTVDQQPPSAPRGPLIVG
jgi:hypothetical protein